MPGEPVVLTSDQGGQIRSLVNALARFPAEPEWTVVGGFAVYVRITDVHRVTNDLDTVSRNQSSLVEVLVAEHGADRLAAAKLRINQDGTEVVVDVMDDTSGKPLPNEPGARAFALARRMALSQSGSIELVVVEDGAVVSRTDAPVATTPSLIALKTVAIPHRSRSRSPEKVGSDIHDLVRLVQSCDFDEVIGAFTDIDPELPDWVGTNLIKLFSPKQDLRYTYTRLRQFARSPDADSLTEDDLAVVSELGEELMP